MLLEMAVLQLAIAFADSFGSSFAHMGLLVSMPGFAGGGAAVAAAGIVLLTSTAASASCVLLNIRMVSDA